jgi:hypothetical protein
VRWALRDEVIGSSVVSVMAVDSRIPSANVGATLT